MREPLCRGLTDENKQTRKSLGGAVPERILMEGDPSQAEAAR